MSQFNRRNFLFVGASCCCPFVVSEIIGNQKRINPWIKRLRRVQQINQLWPNDRVSIRITFSRRSKHDGHDAKLLELDDELWNCGDALGHRCPWTGDCASRCPDSTADVVLIVKESLSLHTLNGCRAVVVIATKTKRPRQLHWRGR